MRKVLLFLVILLTKVFIGEQIAISAGGTLVVGVRKEPHRLDGRSNSVAAYYLPSMVDVLAWVNFDLKMTPQLAESWEILNNGKKYIFHLRKGVRFHCGHPFNAQAVKLNIEGALGRLSNWQQTQETAMIEMVDKVKVLDDYTVEVELKEPSSEFLRAGAHYGVLSMICPVCAEKYGKTDYGLKHLCGTGPFKWGEWVRGSKAVLLKNENYFGKPANVDKIIFKIIPDANARLMALEKGEIDIDIDLPSHEIERLLSSPNINVNLTEGTRTMYLFFNCIKGHTVDKRVRRALMQAININGIVKDVVGPIGVPPTGLVSTKVFGNLDVYRKLVPKYNPGKAKELLAKAGWKDTDGDGLLDKGGKTMDLAITSPNHRAPKDKDCAEAIQSQLKEIGVNAKLQVVEWAYFVTGIKNKSFDAYVFGWRTVTGDCSYPYGALLDSKSRWNPAGYNNPRVDEIVVLGRKEADMQKREKLYYELAKLTIEDGLWMPLFHQNVTVGLRKNIKGFRVHPSGRLFLNNVVIK
jgi:peptide/nickel transport system substrate-binding protein